MRFVLQLRTDSHHTCSMRWIIKRRIIHNCPNNNGVTYCPPRRQNIIERKLRIKSKYLQPLRYRPTLTEMRSLGSLKRRRPVLVYFCSTSNRVTKTPSIKVFSVNVLCARIMECLRASINCIAQEFYLQLFLTRILTRKSYE